MWIQISIVASCVIFSIFILFQIALMLGMPWGSASMGGKFPGVYPVKMRFVAALNAVLLVLMGMVVLSRANVILPDWNPFSQFAIWGVMGFFILGTILNSISPSRPERIWAPFAFLQAICCIIIALN